MEDEGICAQGLGIDGAPVTLGCLNRVGARLKQLNTFLVQVHCVAHKFALCLSITTKTVNPVSNYKDSIMAVYNNFSHSAVRYNKLKWNKPRGNLNYIFRSLSTQGDWVSMPLIVWSIWHLLVLTLEDQAPAHSAKGKGLHNQIRFEFVAITALLHHFLQVIS